MDSIVVSGGGPLQGKVQISGAKNTCLKLMSAALLTDEPLTLTNVPRLSDIKTLSSLLESHGCEVVLLQDGRVMALSASEITNRKADYEIVRKLRASFNVLGPLLAREGEAIVSLPGGCAIGARKVDLHMQAMEKLGAKIELEGGYVHATAPNGLTGAVIDFPFVSVGATENALTAATLAKGTTVIKNAAREPDTVDLAKCLVAMGAKISGAGTSEITVEGVNRLHGATHEVIVDRIELGTLWDTKGGLSVRRRADYISAVDVTTEPFPGYPTDLQAQFMALMCTANGKSVLEETIFENRFMHAPELVRMGANIEVEGGVARVTGVDRLKGAPVMATDLRASVALILAGLAAEGETMVNRVYHLDRGYERIEEKLGNLGANIERVSGG